MSDRPPVRESSPDGGPSRPWQRCRVCSGRVDSFAETHVLQTVHARFDRCATCGSVLARDPTWLGQAYERAIADNDIGLIARNVRLARRLSRFLRVQFGPDATFLDHGGGTGMLVRLMRDAGFDFAYTDPYAVNLFAAGHDYHPESHERFSAVLAVEVLEHLVDPAEHLTDLGALSDTIIATTVVLPEPTPVPDEWWYYSLESGQHVTLYTSDGLDRLARSIGMERTSSGDIHIFSRGRVRPMARVLLNGHPLVDLLTPILKRPSLLPVDYEALTGRRLG